MDVGFTWAFVAVVLLGVAVQLWLSFRQTRHVWQHRDAVPEAYVGSIGLEDHQKAAAYTIDKSRLGNVSLVLSVAILLGWTLLGGLHALNQTLMLWLGPGLAQQIALVLAFMAIGGLIELPLGLYSTFVLEERHGFNKLTFKLWLSDAMKGIVLSLLLIVPLLAAVLWLMDKAGGLWWLWAWGLIVAFQIFLMAIAPNVIMPLFNKFTPLEDEALKKRVETLMQRCGFAAKGLFVMDGSKRSAHSNAFFTGFGATKRVVFFDTLLEKLSADEMEAVLAHELGHFKHRHILKRMLGMFLGLGAGLGLLAWLAGQTWFYTGLGVVPALNAPNDALALLLFTLAVPPFMFFISPWLASRSRRDEFQADAFAAKMAKASDLKAALLKLYKDNASTLTPDPWYVRWYYSHPPAIQRFAALGV